MGETAGDGGRRSATISHIPDHTFDSVAYWYVFDSLVLPSLEWRGEGEVDIALLWGNGNMKTRNRAGQPVEHGPLALSQQ